MKKNRLLPFLLILTIFGLIFSKQIISFAGTMEANNEVIFTGYNKIGDTVKVLNATPGTNYDWKITSQITGEVIKSETNTTGQLKITDEYIESMIECYIAADDITLKMYVSNLPVMYINTQTEYSNINKEEYSEAKIKLKGNKKYTDSSLLYDGTGKIKLRGNSTAEREKKPFRVKLDSSANLLNLGQEDNGKVYKSKHWVLLANDMDHTLIRNKILYDLSGKMGFEYYFKSTNISLIFNGEYVGVYQLCEHRRVDEGRIDITDWVQIGENVAKTIAKKEYAENGYSNYSEMEDELNEMMYQDYSWIDNKYITLNNKKYKFIDYDITLPKTNGGYLAELDFLSMGSNEIANIDTAYGLPFYINYPEAGEDSKDIVSAVNSFKTTSLYKNAKNYTQTFEYALHSKNFVFNSGVHNMVAWPLGYTPGNGWKTQLSEITYTDKSNDGKHYSELFDMNSLVNYFLFNEFIDNYDTMKTSAFFYKEVDELAKMGPMWDFDLTWGNITSWIPSLWYPATWHTTNDALTNAYPFQSYNWFRLLLKDPYFQIKAYERYHEIRPLIEEIVKKDGLIDEYSEYLHEAALANEARWKHTYIPENYSGGNPLGYEDSLESMKEFLKVHVEWMDRQFRSIESLIYSIGYYKTVSEIDFEFNGKYIKIKTINKNCNNVEIQINGKHLIKAQLTNSQAIVEVPKMYLNATDKLNVIVVYEKNENEYILNKSFKPSSNYEHIARSTYKYFKTSDTKLNTTVLSKEVKEIKESNYTTESWNNFKNVYSKAKTILENEKSMQSEIDEILAELKLAKLKLVAKDKTITEIKPEIIVTPSDEIIITPSDDIKDKNDNEDSYHKNPDNNEIVKVPNKKQNSINIIWFILPVFIIIGLTIIIVLKKKSKKTSE